MNKYSTIMLMASLAVVFSCTPLPTFSADARLNPAQSEHLNNLIRTQLPEQADRDIINNWTEAQRVAEFVCRPLAYRTIRKHYPVVDMVILDQGKDNEQHLVSETLLTGNGQYRIGYDWIPFHFQCEISDNTIKALNFQLIDKTKNSTLVAFIHTPGGKNEPLSRCNMGIRAHLPQKSQA